MRYDNSLTDFCSNSSLKSLSTSFSMAFESSAFELRLPDKQQREQAILKYKIKQYPLKKPSGRRIRLKGFEKR